jgi:hypothetical protein
MSFCPNTGIEGFSEFFRRFYKYSFITHLKTIDTDVTHCLTKMNIYPAKSTDDFRRVIFNPYNFYFYNYTLPKHRFVCCSNISFVSAHYMTPEDMIRLDLILKQMNHFHSQGKISKLTYEDVLRKYKSLGSFLNLSELKEKRHH